MTTSGLISQFTDVDQAPEAGWFVTFMDRVNALDEYADIRLSMIEELKLGVGTHVLDLGCGTGDDARELQQVVGRPGQVLGIDSSSAMVDEARGRNRGHLAPSFREGDAEQLDLEDESVDACRAKLVLMHCVEAGKVLDQMIRVTRSGGRIAAFDYDFDTTTVDHSDRATTRAVITALSDAHPGSWTARSNRAAFIDRGLDDVAVRPIVVQMPWQVWSTTVKGRIAECVAASTLDGDAVARWWSELEGRALAGRFHTSITGFLVSGTKS